MSTTLTITIVVVAYVVSTLIAATAIAIYVNAVGSSSGKLKPYEVGMLSLLWPAVAATVIVRLLLVAIARAGAAIALLAEQHEDD